MKMVQEGDEYVLKGDEPHVPISEDTIGKILFDSLISNPTDQVAMVDVSSGKTITYKTILEEGCKLAEALLQYGCNTNTIISISSENNLEFFVPVVASLFAGIKMAPLNPLYKAEEIRHAINLFKPKIVFTSQLSTATFLQLKSEASFVEKIVVLGAQRQFPGTQTLAEFCFEQLGGGVVSPHDFAAFNEDAARQVALLLSSSGTTGLPKGVMLTHRNLAVRIAQTNDPRYAEDIGSPVTLLGLMPFFHAFGLNTGVTSLINRHLIVVMNRFDEDKYLQAIEDYKINVLYIAPPLAVFMVKTPKLDKYDLSSIRDVYCSAASLSQQIEDTLKKRLKLRAILQLYGLTECTFALALNERNAFKPGSVGRVVAGMSLKIRDPETGNSLPPHSVGEICAKGPQIMLGYYNNEKATREAFTEDGWYRTGDLGYYDTEGYFFIVDRLKELIKYNGYQVAPAELEAILLSHPDVRDAGVIGIPDEKAGELPTAFVVRRNNKVTEKQLQDVVAEKLSPQKWLRGGVVFVEEIPKNTTGKILRKELSREKF